MKKSIITLIISILVLALLGGGYYFAVKWEPEKEAEENTQAPSSETIYLIEAERENIESVEYCTDGKAYKIINGEAPSIEGYSSVLLKNESLDSIISSVLIVSATREIQNPKKPENYGLDKREKFITVNFKDKTSRTVIIGDETNFEDEFYASVEGESKVYTLSSYKVGALLKNPDDLRETDICSIDTTTVKEFAISRSGNKVVSFILDESEKKEEDAASVMGMNGFIVTYPYKNLPASLDKINSIFEKITAITAETIVEENPKNLSAYGISGGTELMITDGSKTHLLKLGNKTENGSVYLMYNDIPVVYTAVCDFYGDVVNALAEEFIERFIHIFNINTIESIALDIDGEKTELSIEGDVDKDGDAKFYVNKKSVSEDGFKKLYQSIIGITLTSVADREPSGEKKCGITFKFKDKTQKTFTYYRYDERYSIVKTDEGINCLTLTKNIDAITEALKLK